jgi:hypothetical protein
MKKLLLIALTTLSTYAIAQTNIFPSSGYVGIGTTDPTERLNIVGGHADTKLRLYSTGNGSDMPANLSLWASEPGWTYYGTGIGYNVNGSPYYGRIDNTRGSSYLRFLPDETKFEFQNTSGGYINALTIKEDGNVGVGTTTPPQQLSITGGIGFANQNANDKKLYSPQDGMLEWVTHDAAAEHGFVVSHQGERRVLLNTKGNSYLIGGNVGIGTITPAYKLDVLGTIRAKEVLVNLDGGADFVFEKGYKLLPIEHVANYVQENKHLPDIPSANEMVKNGVSMGDMQVKLLQKVEELTLYAIQQDQSKKELEAKLAKQENQYNALLEKVEMLTKQMEKK